jgi:GNAT superfamily N-acetyltransferase
MTLPLKEPALLVTEVSVTCYEKSEDNYLWSLTRDGVEIGRARVTRYYTPKRRRVRIAVDTLDIVASYRNRGLGSLLMQEMCRAYGDEEMQLVAVADRDRLPRLKRLYERYGFEAYRAGRTYAYMRRQAHKET